jgi:hypothetical protein
MLGDRMDVRDLDIGHPPRSRRLTLDDAPADRAAEVHREVGPGAQLDALVMRIEQPAVEVARRGLVRGVQLKMDDATGDGGLLPVSR